MKSESKRCSSIQQASFKSASCSGIRSTSKTENTVAGPTFSHFGKPLNVSPLCECDSSPEPSNIWVKRLRHNPSDSASFASKRLKTRDDSNSAQARNLLGIILNYDDCNNYLSKCLEEQQDFANTRLLKKDEFSYGESKAVNNWIRRWCCGSRQAAPLQKLAPPVLCEPERSNAIHKTLDEKQLPSIATMALMGAAAKNSHLSRFHRKGSLLFEVPLEEMKCFLLVVCLLHGLGFRPRSDNGRKVDKASNDSHFPDGLLEVVQILPTSQPICFSSPILLQSM